MAEVPYPVPPRPRVHCWVSSKRSVDGVVEIKWARDSSERPTVTSTYRVVDPNTETTVFEGDWKSVTEWAVKP